MHISNKFIRRCFDLAQRGLGSTSPNPSVGAVIVDNTNRIIGEGWTSPFGGPHAEVNAVASVKLEEKHLLSSATIFVSLEPCFHFGKTPPCVDLILKEKIPHVVIAYMDPFPFVAGKSIQKLKEQGVKVEIVIHEDNNKDSILLPFFTNVSTKRPFIILKWAETADGFIGDALQTIPISNIYTKRLVHKWRSEVDGIMVGTNTAALDNPELTNRLYFGKSPVRIVLDKKRRLSHNLHVFDGSVKTLIYTEGEIPKDDIHPQTSVDYRSVPFDGTLLPHILKDLYSQNIGILLVEGGAQLLNTFIEKGLWDEARVFKTTKTLISPNGIPAPKIADAQLEKKIQLFDNQLLIFRPA